LETLTLMRRIYELLSDSSENDLIRAAKLAGIETGLGRALSLLAEYRREHGGKSFYSGSAMTVIRNAESIGAAPEDKKHNPKKPDVRADFDRKLRDLILSKRYFAKAADLLRYLKKSGLPIVLSSKMSRQRIFSKLKSELAKSDNVTRTLAIQRLFAIFQENETSRWFDVIRKDE
jgi:hypothetical protein